MMNKSTFFLIFFVFLFSQMTHSQSRIISGTVTSSSTGLRLADVKVVLKGSTLWTVTDTNGFYSLTFSGDQQALIFALNGMRTQEVIPGSQPVINILMEPQPNDITEEIITALGISRNKESLGYAVQEVQGDEISSIHGDNFVYALSGRVAGLRIKNTGNLWGSTDVMVRGASSLTGNNQALIVVDGIVIDNSSLNSSDQMRGSYGYDYGTIASDINMDDIASISVLKGAAACALYGSRGSNGVLLITTKTGKHEVKPGKLFGVDFTSNVTLGFIDKSTFPKYQKEYGAGYGIDWYSDSSHPGLEEFDVDGDGVNDWVVPFYEDASMGEKFDPNLQVYQWDATDPESPNYLKKTPWIAAANGPETFFQKAVGYTNSISVNGADDCSSFRLSYTNRDKTGILPNSSYKRNNLMFNGSYQLLKSLKIKAEGIYAETITKGRNSTGYSDNILGSFRQWFQTNVDLKAQEDMYRRTGRNVTWNRTSFTNSDPAYQDNPYWTRYENYETDQRNQFMGVARVDYTIIRGLNIMGQFSYDKYDELQEVRRAVGSTSVGWLDGSYVTSGYSKFTRTFKESQINLMLTYEKEFTNKLSLNVNLGANSRRNSVEDILFSTNGGLAVPGIYSISNSKQPINTPNENSYNTKGLANYFGFVTVGYDHFLFLEGTYGSEQLPMLSNKKATSSFFSASSGFVFSRFINSEVISYGKFRLNYSQTGNYSLPSSNSMSNIYSVQPGRTKAFETGLEMNFLHNRLRFGLNLYKSSKDNQLLSLAVHYATGYNYQYVNAGEMSNKGVEFTLKATPVKTNDLTWNIDINWARNKNKVVSLAEGFNNLQLGNLQGGVSINARVGQPYGTIQGTDYVYYNNNRTPENRIVENGVYQETLTADQVIGNVNPDWTVGIANTLSYKNLKLSFLIDWQHGGDLFSLDMWYGSSTGLYKESTGLNDLGNPARNYVTGNPATDGGVILPGVLPDGTKNTVRSNDMGTYYTPVGSAHAPNAMFIYDAGYIKLREVSLTYTLPSELLEKTLIQNVSVSLVGNNLWIISKHLPYSDPEFSQSSGNIQGWQSGTLPGTRNVGFSLRVEF